jgi:hypothetical protein
MTAASGAVRQPNLYELRFGQRTSRSSFPQGGKGGWLLPPDKLVVRSGDRVYEPTLSELIAECGDGFESVRRMFDGGRTLGWEAWSANLDLFNRMFHGEGPSPEEAVARLWLALNKPTV